MSGAEQPSVKAHIGVGVKTLQHKLCMTPMQKAFRQLNPTDVAPGERIGFSVEGSVFRKERMFRYSIAVTIQVNMCRNTRDARVLPFSIPELPS